MKGGSLCTGGGGLDLGLARTLDIEWAWHSESDQAAAAVLDHHYPGVPNHGDLVNFDWQTAEPVDLVAAGFPCPDYSHAGRRVGIGGGHGQVWFGVATALRTLRPSYVILENVPGIRTAPGLRVDAGESALGVVLADLAALGYRWAYDRMRASDLGAPHIRDRWFLIGRLAADASSEGRRQVSGGAPRDEGAAGWWPADTDHEPGRARPSGLRTADRAAPSNTGSLAGTTTGERDGGSGEGGEQTARGDTRETLDGAAGCARGSRSPSPADTAGERRDGRSTGEDGDAGGRQETERPQGDTDSGDGGRVAWGTYEPAIRRWEAILGRSSPEPTDDRGGLNPRFVEWMLGYPDGWVSTIEIPRTAQLRILGNSVQVQCAERVGSWLERLTAGGIL